MLSRSEQCLRRPTTLCSTRALLSAFRTIRLNSSGGLIQPKQGNAKLTRISLFQNDFIDNSHLDRTGGRRFPNNDDGTHSLRDAFLLQQAIAELHPELMRDADTVKTKSTGPPLILPDPLEEPSAWVEALEQQGQLHGIQGIIRVWAVRKREEYKLPLEGRDANALWSTLFRAAIVERATEDHRELFKGVYEHALEVNSEAKLSWSGLYTCVVGLLLRVQPSNARTAHKELVNAFDCTHVDLRDLATDCANSRDPMLAFKAFRNIYKTFPQRNLYDAFLVPLMSDQHSDRTRFDWHNFFVSRGDLPSSGVFALPLVQDLFTKKGKPPVPQPQPPESVAPQPAITKLQAEHFPPLTRASMSALVGDVHGIKPKQISDSFVAKLLATWAFPLDFLVNGIGFLAIESLGPQALRQLALRCGNCTVFGEKIEELKRLGIESKASNYARVMHYVAREGQESMFQTLLRSDQHPDTFGDAKVQTALLHAFLRRNDLHNAHLTLIVLSLLEKRGNANAWNAVLKYNIWRRDEPAIESLVRRMRSLQIAVDLENLLIFRARIVGYRRAGHRPVHRVSNSLPIQPLNFLAGMAMFSLHNGVNVGAKFWIELLKRYGMARYWKSVERLTMWLLSRYRLDRDPEWAARCGLDNRDVHRDCQAIFSHNLLGALVVWGLRPRSPGSPHDTPPVHPQFMNKSHNTWQAEPWARGLVLLRRIELQSNMPTILTARKAIRQRMWILFGPAYSARAINPETVRLHNLTLSHCVLHANQIFEGRLFPGIESFFDGPEATSRTAVMTMLFGQVKSSDGRLQLIPASLGRLRYELNKRKRNLKYRHKLKYNHRPPYQHRPYYYRSLLMNQVVI